MTNQPTPFIARDIETGDALDFDPLDGNHDLEAQVRAGELTRAQADELLQAAERRQTAEHGADLGDDPGATITEGGFGSDQGMASQSKRHGNVS